MTFLSSFFKTRKTALRADSSLLIVGCGVVCFGLFMLSSGKIREYPKIENAASNGTTNRISHKDLDTSPAIPCPLPPNPPSRAKSSRPETLTKRVNAVTMINALDRMFHLENMKTKRCL